MEWRCGLGKPKRVSNARNEKNPSSLRSPSYLRLTGVRLIGLVDDNGLGLPGRSSNPVTAISF